ncbi:hypothetical protein ACOME3_009536 [Neoechinorhynchus agilis]
MALSQRIGTLTSKSLLAHSSLTANESATSKSVISVSSSSTNNKYKHLSTSGIFAQSLLVSPPPSSSSSSSEQATFQPITILDSLREESSFTIVCLIAFFTISFVTFLLWLLRNSERYNTYHKPMSQSGNVKRRSKWCCCGSRTRQASQDSRRFLTLERLFWRTEPTLSMHDRKSNSEKPLLTSKDWQGSSIVIDMFNGERESTGQEDRSSLTMRPLQQKLSSSGLLPKQASNSPPLFPSNTTLDQDSMASSTPSHTTSHSFGFDKVRSGFKNKQLNAKCTEHSALPVDSNVGRSNTNINKLRQISTSISQETDPSYGIVLPPRPTSNRSSIVQSTDGSESERSVY